MGIAALVLGIISVVIAVAVPYLGWIGIIVGIIGIILAAIAKKNGEGGIATAGLVLSIIGAALALILYLACAACVSSVAREIGNLDLSDLDLDSIVSSSIS